MHASRAKSSVIALVLIALVLAPATPVYAQPGQDADYQSYQRYIGNIVRHPLQLPPEPPTVYNSYLNLTDSELSCTLFQAGATLLVAAGLLDNVITNRLSEFPSPDDAAEAAIQEYPGYITVYGYTINKSSPQVLAELGRLMLEASIYSALGNRSMVENRLVAFSNLLENGGTDAIQDSLEIAALNITISPLLKLIYIMQLYHCVAPEAPPGAETINYYDFLRATETLAKSLNTTNLTANNIDVTNITKSLDLIITYNIHRSSLYLDLLRDVGRSGFTALVFELPECREPPANLSSPVLKEKWSRLQCIIPWIYTTRLSLIAHLSLARWNGEAWMLPTPLDSTIELYSVLNRLRLFSDALFIEMQPSITVAYNTTTNTSIPETEPGIEPIGLEEEARTLEDLLGQLGDELPDTGLQGNVMDSVQDRADDQVVVDLEPRVRKIGVDDLKSIVSDILRAREALKTGVTRDAGVSYNSSIPSIGVGSLTLPSLPFYAFLAPLAVFAAYMAREYLESLGYMAKGALASRVRRRSVDEAVACYNSLLKRLEAKGVYKMPWETPREFLEKVRRSGVSEDLVYGLEAATRAVEASLYSRDGRPLEEDLDACWRSARPSFRLRPGGS
ncbi:MAG: DUF4129 domain-containing protein [Desulfurococcales archaeon]|nr:DUF4129 domain-containing protein [Desulfurococcales archaeon]